MQKPLDLLKETFGPQEIDSSLEGIKLITNIPIPTEDNDTSKRIRYENIRSILTIFKSNGFIIQIVKGLVIRFTPPDGDFEPITINFMETLAFTAEIQDFYLPAVVLFSKNEKRLMTFNDKVKHFSHPTEI